MIFTRHQGRFVLVAPAASLVSRIALALPLLVVENCRVGHDTTSFYSIRVR